MGKSGRGRATIGYAGEEKKEEEEAEETHSKHEWCEQGMLGQVKAKGKGKGKGERFGCGEEGHIARNCKWNNHAPSWKGK